MANNEPNLQAVAARTARATIARLTAASEHRALTFAESKTLAHARRF